MKNQVKEREITPYNVLNNRVAKVALAASLLLTGTTTTIATVGPSNGIVGELIGINHAEAADVFAGGTGTVADPYLIADKTQLNEMRNFLTSHFKLTNNIDLTGVAWMPVGTGPYASTSFAGSLDGNDFTINGLTINKTSSNYTGLFGHATGDIKNIHLTNVNVKGSHYIGGIAGQLDGKIYNVSVEGVIIGLDFTGGVVGNLSSSNASIEEASSTATVTGRYNVGGVAGNSDSGTIKNSFSTGDVTGESATGGILGFLSKGNLLNVYSTGDVKGNALLGGILGYADSNATNSLTNAYASGAVTSVASQTGGIIGESKGGTFSNLYALNKEVYSSSVYHQAGKAFGRKLGGNITAVSAIDTMTGNGHSDGIDNTITMTQAMQKGTYPSFEFGETGDVAIWAIDEGETLPYLVMSSDSDKQEPIDPEALALEKAIAAVEQAENSKTQADIDLARDLVNKLADGEAKTDLTNRLDDLQNGLDDDKALQDAKDAVDNLGDHPTQEELDAAKDKVDALPDSPEKDELLNQIKDKQEALDQENADKALAEQIAKATEAVVKAEGSQTQVDMDAARDLVSKLPDGEVKIDLTNRLDAIEQATDEDKALEEAKDAVDNLGDNPTQEEIDKVKDKVDELSDGPAKDIILDQIKEKQDALNQANATKAVEKAEASKTQVDVNAARDLVKKLSDGEVKTDLTNRLDVLQLAIDAAKHLEEVRSLVNNLGDNPTQVKIDQARSSVDGLSDSVDKTELSEMVDAKQKALDAKVTDAREAVEAISTPPTLEKIANAQEKVTLLPAGDIKNDLQKQINDKKKQLDDMSDQLAKAEAAVTKAESFPTNYNVTIATKLVQALPNSEAKTTLEERLQAIQDVFDLEKAEAKVKQAENYERDPYLADAIAIVDALKDSAGKQALKDRLQVILDKLQAIKDAEEAAKDANGAYDPADPNQSIEDAIDTIQDPAAKKYFTNWNKAVSNAENFFSKTTVKNATKYLTDLPDAYTLVASYENIIQELTERTQNLKAEEVAVDVFAPVEKAVAMYEKFQSTYYLKKATEAVQALPDSPEKTAFEIRLGIGDGNGTPGNEPTEEEKLAAQLASVEKAVATYEKYKTNFYQKKAAQAVEALADSEAKTAFQARLDAVN